MPAEILFPFIRDLFDPATDRKGNVMAKPNPDKPEKIATKAQRRTVYYILTSCLGVLVAKKFC